MEENSGFSRQICLDTAMISKVIVAKIYSEFNIYVSRILTIRLQGLHLPYPSHLHRVQRENSIRCSHYAFLLRDVII